MAPAPEDFPRDLPRHAGSGESAEPLAAESSHLESGVMAKSSAELRDSGQAFEFPWPWLLLLAALVGTTLLALILVAVVWKSRAEDARQRAETGAVEMAETEPAADSDVPVETAVWIPVVESPSRERTAANTAGQRETAPPSESDADSPQPPGEASPPAGDGAEVLAANDPGAGAPLAASGTPPAQPQGSSDSRRFAAAEAPRVSTDSAPVRTQHVRVAAESPGEGSASPLADRPEPQVRAAAERESSRLPVPDASAIARAERQLRASGGLPTPADDSSEGRREAADRLLAAAGQSQDAAERYALLDRACELATSAGDVQLPFTAIQQMGHAFAADTVQRSVEAVRGLAAAVKRDEDRRRLAHRAREVGSQAACGEQFELADEMYDVGLNFCRRLRYAELQAVIHRDREGLADRIAACEAADQAREVLQRHPDAAAAHGQLGRYLCFYREDWPKGLPHLARSDEPPLVAAARRDLDSGEDAESLAAAGDAWFDWAETAQGQEQRAAWLRAREAYQRAGSGLKEPLASRVMARLEQLARLLDRWDGGSPETPVLPWLDGPSGQLQTFEAHDRKITALAVSARGGLLASAGEDRSVRLWQLPSGQRIWSRSTQTGNLNGLEISPDEQFVIANYDNLRFRIWSAASGDVVGEVPGGGRAPAGLALTADGRHLLWSARCRPPNVFVWNLADQRLQMQFGTAAAPTVLDLADDSRTLVTGDAYGVVRRWDLKTGKMLGEFAVHPDAVTDLDVCPRAGVVATASFGELCVTDLETGETRGRCEIPEIRTAAISPDGRRVASGGIREEVLLWDRTLGQRLPGLREERAFSERRVWQLAFLPDPRGLVTGADDGMIRLWKLPE